MIFLFELDDEKSNLEISQTAWFGTKTDLRAVGYEFITLSV